eukprot:9182384-Ditylum_brightwellii.AAC.1
MAGIDTFATNMKMESESSFNRGVKLTLANHQHIFDKSRLPTDHELCICLRCEHISIDEQPENEMILELNNTENDKYNEKMEVWVSTKKTK